MTENADKSFIQNLWDRKVPQYLGTYFAVGFGLLQFVEFIIERYAVGDALLDKYLFVWFALVPAIVLISYFGTRLKSDAAVLKWPKALIAGNVVIALLLGTLLFNNKATAQSTVVELIDEEGKTLTAVVPVLNKVKTIANFQFENATGDKANDWYGVPFSHLLQQTLELRPEFYTYSSYALNGYHDGLGLPLFETPNLGMQREIAQKSRNDYFTNIRYTILDEKFEFKGNLFSSRDGKSLIELSATDTNLYRAIDKLKQQIFDKIPNGIPAEANQVSMSSSTLVTANIEALKYYSESRITLHKDPTALEETLHLVNKAIELDPACSECHYFAGQALYALGRNDEAIKVIKQAIQYGKALPERMQFNAKEMLYSLTNNMDAYWKLQEIRRKMFPYEFVPYQRLLILYQADYGIERSKALMQEAIDNGNVEKGLIALYNLQLQNDEYIEALKTLKRCSVEFPDRDQDRLKYATIYERQGNIKEAKAVLTEEEALDPLNTSIQTRLATLDFKNQDIPAATKRIDQLLSQTTTITDSLNLMWTKSNFLENMGQIANAFKTISDYENLAIKRMTLSTAITNTFSRKLAMHQAVGKAENIEGLIDELNKYSPQSNTILHCAISVNAIQNDFDTAIDEDQLASCHTEYQNFGKGYGEYFDIIRAYHTGDYNTCVTILEGDDGKIRKLITDKYFLSNIYVKVEDFKEAKAVIKKEIDQKTDQPKYYYQMALLLEGEDQKAAKTYLDIALLYWANADPDYIPFQRAQALAKRLGQTQLKL